MNNITHIADGKRKWKPETLEMITSLLRDIVDKSPDYLIMENRLGEILGQALIEANFNEVGHRTWTAKNWSCEIKLRKINEDLGISINGVSYKARDIYPLWNILREIWNSSLK